MKSLKTYSREKSVKENFPNVDYCRNKYILPIKPEYHTSLLPDSVLKTENEGDYMKGLPYRYALQKVYITFAYGDTSFVKKGDIVLFYRNGEDGTQKKYSSVITTVGVIDEYITTFQNKDEYMKSCQNRSVFSSEELNLFWQNKSSSIKVLKFIFCTELKKKVTLNQLYQMGIVESGKGPRPFHHVSDEQFELIIAASETKLYRG